MTDRLPVTTSARAAFVAMRVTAGRGASAWCADQPAALYGQFKVDTVDAPLVTLLKFRRGVVNCPGSVEDLPNLFARPGRGPGQDVEAPRGQPADDGPEPGTRRGPTLARVARDDMMRP